MEIFDESKLRLAIKGLPDWKCVAFMAYCCERMLPNYGQFSAQTSFGAVGVLRGGLDDVWIWVESSRTPIDLDALILSCEQLAPDTSKFSSIYTSAALDASTAVSITLDALGKFLEEQVIDVAKIARDSVDLYVQEKDGLDPNDPLLEEKILKNGLMQSELRVQRESLIELASLNEPRELAASHLHSKWSNLKQGSLDLHGSEAVNSPA